MATARPFRVTRLDDLDQLVGSPAASVVLELRSLDSDETRRWQSELDRLLRTCGCGEAAAALLVNAAALAIAACCFWSSVKQAPFLSLAIVSASCALSIAVGKAFGQWMGRRRLAASARQLKSVITSREAALAGHLASALAGQARNP